MTVMDWPEQSLGTNPAELLWELFDILMAGRTLQEGNLVGDVPGSVWLNVIRLP